MMQTNLERFAVFGSADPTEREVDFAQRREEEARRLGLPWPRPVVRVGRPSMDVKWQQVLYKALDNNDFPALAALTNAKAPPWWKQGMGIKQSIREGAAVAAVGHMLVQEEPVVVLDEEQSVLDQDQVATEEPDKKKRKKTMVARPLQIWLLHFMRHMESTKNWSGRKTFATVQTMVPEVFGDLHPDSWRRWDEAKSIVKAETRGRKAKVSPAALHELTFLAHQLASA
eukprot:2681104-Amphidinium_carterae.1